MNNIQPILDISTQREELAAVKSVLASIVLQGLDGKSVSAYLALERALEAQIAEYDRKNDFTLTCKELKDTPNIRRSDVLSWVAEYLKNERYIFGMAR